jgi:acetyl coenzyme A synthetase (ADP forming)-like protein
VSGSGTPPDYPAVWESDVVLADGGTVHLRPIRADDDEALLGLYSRLSDESIYLRFFSPVPRPTASQIEHLTGVDYDRRFALVAELGDDVVGVARYDRTGEDEAEVAFTVQDDQQGRGLGTIMLEHLAAIARAHGIGRFVAETLPQNQKMLGVFRDAGFASTRTWDEGTYAVTLDLEPTAEAVDAQNEREHVSEARSIHRLLHPASVAVIGASRTAGTIGNALVRNLLTGDFSGPVYPVNPNATSIAGVRAFANIRDIPDHVDLAVIAVPAAAVLEVARDCAVKGVGGLVVVSAGFAEVEGARQRERDLVAVARRNGMRLVGPNCMGVVNTNPAIRLNATFAPFPAVRGRIGFASQSGGLGIELIARAGEFGLGISTFVSMGNKADVSGNDLLQYWDEDPDTDVMLLYLESFGNPRKFARLARRVALRKPIVAVKSGRTPAGARATSSHTAALATPDVAVDALFRQAGVIRVDTLEELFATAAVLLHQPLPAGRRVAIVTNGGGPGILAADACTAAGLEVPELAPTTQAKLASFASPDAGLRNPVDLVASASAADYERAVATLLATDEIDALIAIFVPPLVTQPDEVARAIVTSAQGAGDKPVIASFLGRTGTLDVLSGGDGVRPVPTFAFPEASAAALGRAADLAAWRRRPAGVVPTLADVDAAAGRALVDERLTHHPEGEWLDPHVARDLLACFGVPIVATSWVASAAGAAAAAAHTGFPVALKAGAGELVHKSDVGGVALGLETPEAVERAFTAMLDELGDAMGGAVVQPMVPPGVETIVGVTRDPSFGSLVLFGMGGFEAELTRDTQLRIVPLTDVDAHELVRELRASPLLFGYRNTPRVDVDALEQLLLRIGCLAEALPEVAELDCNPVVVSPRGAVVVDWKLRLEPHAPAAPAGLRRLRAPT